MSRLAFAQFASQFGLALCWAVYVAYLPRLLAANGIDKSWLLPILIVDQLIFAVADIACGAALDRIGKPFARFGKWMVATVIVSTALFILLPLISGRVPSGVFLAVLFVWVACSSLARVPPLAILAKQTSSGEMRGPLICYLLGIGLASAFAPYLATLLANQSPLLPFALASIVLALAIIVTMNSLQGADAMSDDVITREAPASPLPLMVYLLPAAVAMQIHTAVNSAPLYKASLPGTDLAWLMPVFWAAFSMTMLPASVLSKRLRNEVLTMVSATLFLIAIIVALVSRDGMTLLPAQIAAGAGWALLCTALFDIAQQKGRAGREGRFIGIALACFALAAVLRLLLVLSTQRGLAIPPSLMLWLPVALTAFVLTVAAIRARH